MNILQEENLRHGDFMEGVLQQNIFEISIKLSIERENLLIKKIQHYHKNIKDKDLANMLLEFEKTAREHIHILTDKKEKLNPTGSLKR